MSLEQDELEFAKVGAETEEDVASGLKQTVSSAVLWSTDWTAETILGQLVRGNIGLNPSFQRREAWDVEKKSRFIESLILGFPVPQIVLAERKEKRGSYIVIDGKQRLLTIRRFCAEADSEYKPFTLRGLAIRDDLNGLSYKDFQENPDFSAELDAFQNQSIRTTVLKNWPNEKFLFAVFLRLNTGSVPLSPQELRQALHPGPFLEFADDFSAKCTALQTVLRKDGPDFRMRDVELIIRYFAFQKYLQVYSGNLKEFLDHACFDLNQRWATDQEEIRQCAQQLDTALVLTLEVFGHREAFRKWSGGEFETRFNRAVFDVMVFYFARIDRDLILSKRVEIKSAFINLCANTPAFVKAVESTTKSVSETATRLQLWGDVLSNVLAISFAIPYQMNGSIKFR